MNQKSITFRCSHPQQQRLRAALRRSPETRTALLTAALSTFLDYTARAEIRQLNLFALVHDIDTRTGGPPFSTQA